MTMIGQSGAASRALTRRSSYRGTTALMRCMLAASAMLASGVAHAGPALPTGGTVTSGSATIGAPASGTLTINQSSNKAIINWNSFSIGQGASVNFNNGAGATLNRVTGSASSAINGTLNATGSVYLINPNGVVVGKTGVVNVGRNFVASTLNTTDAQFNASGPLTFSGNSQATVVNYGKIGSLGGDVALIATNAKNAGTIAAPNGSVGVLAGSQVTLRDSSLDDGKFSVDVGSSSDNATNSGTIAAADAELKANGGNVYNAGSVSNAYATGNAGIATTHTVGGLIGNNVGHVSNVYAAGHVTGAATKGALFGANGAASVVSNAYYDTLVTGSLAAIGSNANASVHPVALNASLSPTAQASYAGFDFSAIWMIASGQMPRLQHTP